MQTVQERQIKRVKLDHKEKLGLFDIMFIVGDSRFWFEYNSPELCESIYICFYANEQEAPQLAKLNQEN